MLLQNQTVLPEIPWYALRVRPRHEKSIAAILSQKGYRTLLPMHRVRRRWSDRIAELDLPLFVGYVFCQFDLNDRRIPILNTPGVIQFIGVGKVPQPLDAKGIADIWKLTESGAVAEPCK